MTPGSGIRNRFFSGSRIRKLFLRAYIKPIFSWVKNFFSRLSVTAYWLENDKMCNSYESRSVSARAESCKKVRKQILKNFFYFPMFFAIRDPRWEKIRIRDKHPGSATLQLIVCTFIVNNELFLQK